MLHAGWPLGTIKMIRQLRLGRERHLGHRNTKMSYRTISEIQRDAKESEARFNAQRALEDAERRVFRERSRELELKMAQDESTFKIIFIVFTFLAVLPNLDSRYCCECDDNEEKETGCCDSS